LITGACEMRWCPAVAEAVLSHVRLGNRL